MISSYPQSALLKPVSHGRLELPSNYSYQELIRNIRSILAESSSQAAAAEKDSYPTVEGSGIGR